LNKGIGLNKFAFSVITVAIISFMVSPTSAFAEPAWCAGMATNDMMSNGAEQAYTIMCTDYMETNNFTVLNNLIAPQVISSVGANTQLNADPPGIELITSNTQSEVSGASDPTGQSVVIGWNDSEQFFATGSFNGYARSANGGATWVDGGVFPTGPVHNLFGDPVIAYSPNIAGGAGHIHASLAVDFTAPLAALSAITIQISNNGGVTWGNPINVATSLTDFLDKEWIATGPNPAGGFDIIHASWTDFVNGDCFLFSCPIQYSRSLDGGLTWSPPITFNILGASQGSFIVVDSTGNNVYVFWEDFVSGNQVVNISNDAGANFGGTVTIAPINFAGIFDNDCQRFTWNGQHRINQFVSAAINPVNGDLYVTWADGEFQGSPQTDIVVYRSTNGGANWAQVATPHPALPNNDQFIPFMDTAPDGEIKMIWYDRRNDAQNLAIEVWAASSTDGGSTWAANTLISSAPFTAPSLSPNPDPLVTDCYFVGEYNVIDVPTLTFAHAAWGDGRVLTTGGNPQPQPDVFYSTLQQFVEPPPTPQPPVGGEFLPIDSTALLLAGMQTNSVWILSAFAVVASVAFGALYISARRK